MIDIIIIDDDKIICDALSQIINQNESYNVLAVGYSYDDAIRLFYKYKPDIALFDIRLAEKNGIDAAERILSDYPEAKIIFLSTFSEDEYILKAVSIGAKGYIIKHDIDTIITSLKSVNNGQVVFAKEVYEKLPTLLKNKKEKQMGALDFTEMQIDILANVALGLNNKEIAEKLFLGEGTVRNYISNLLTKLDLRNRTELAIYYYKNIKM